MGWFLCHGSTDLKWVKNTHKTYDYKERVIIYLYSSEQRIKYLRSYIFHFRWNSRIQSEHQCTGKMDPNCSFTGNSVSKFKAMLELGGTQKENAPQTTKSGKSEKIVQELLRTFSRVANLFTFDRTSDVNNKYPLMTICCSVVMRNEDAEQLLQASSIGEQEIGKAVSKKFNSTTTFSARIKKVMLPTFVPLASIALQPIVEIKMHLYDRKAFQRLAVIEMSRTVDLGDILTYELGPATLSLAKPNGNMNKTAKNKLMQELEVDSSVNDISTTGKRVAALSLT